jgi:hypothetical protein
MTLDRGFIANEIFEVLYQEGFGPNKNDDVSAMRRIAQAIIDSISQFGIVTFNNVDTDPGFGTVFGDIRIIDEVGMADRITHKLTNEGLLFGNNPQHLGLKLFCEGLVNGINNEARVTLPNVDGAGAPRNDGVISNLNVDDMYHKIAREITRLGFEPPNNENITAIRILSEGIVEEIEFSGRGFANLAAGPDTVQGTID